MAPFPSLNRRHKVGLFLVLVATGLSLFLEASAKQTAGIALLGVAFAWLFGSLSLRVLLLWLCSLTCATGVGLVGFPLWQEHSLVEAKAQEYDSAVAEIRAAVATASLWEDVPPETLPADFFAKKKPKGSKDSHAKYGGSLAPSYSDVTLDFIPDNRRPIREGETSKPGTRTERDVLLPVAALKWLRPGPEQSLSSEQITAEFPGRLSQEEIINLFRTKILLPKPSFSFAGAIVAERTPVVCGGVLVAFGLFGFAGVLGWTRGVKRVTGSAA